MFVSSLDALPPTPRRWTRSAWWEEVERHPRAAPGIVRELLRGPSVVCYATEAQQALAWARAHPAWVDEPAPLYVHDTGA